MQKHKLYRLTSDSWKLPLYVDDHGALTTVAAIDIPLILWPDGRWCHIGNAYMLRLFERGLSRRNRGGTLFTYATNISHLLRLLYQRRIAPEDLSDNQFTAFVHSLLEERTVAEPNMPLRDANTVLAIGRASLDFLAFVATRIDDTSLLGPNGRIHAELKEAKLWSTSDGSGRSRTVRFWHHASFPTPDPRTVVLPISAVSISKLRDSVDTISTSHFLRKRRYVLIKLLEITGSRRSEVAALTVDSIRRASRMHDPMLRIITVKKGGGRAAERLLPISHHDVAFLLEFIEVNRSRIIRKTCGTTGDTGVLLISERTGRPLEAPTITKEIHTLAKAAGIAVKICPHMFRHRFITKLFVWLINQHNIENEDSFRRLLLDGNAMREKVRQWTGHANLASLDTYIHMAFDEAANFGKVETAVNLRRVVESFRGTVEQTANEMHNAMKNKESTLHIAESFTHLLREFVIDLEKAVDVSQPSGSTQG